MSKKRVDAQIQEIAKTEAQRTGMEAVLKLCEWQHLRKHKKLGGCKCNRVGWIQCERFIQ
jgi:hypothetical protein